MKADIYFKTNCKLDNVKYVTLLPQEMAAVFFLSASNADLIFIHRKVVALSQRKTLFLILTFNFVWVLSPHQKSVSPLLEKIKLNQKIRDNLQNHRGPM